MKRYYKGTKYAADQAICGMVARKHEDRYVGYRLYPTRRRKPIEVFSIVKIRDESGMIHPVFTIVKRKGNSHKVIFSIDLMLVAISIVFICMWCVCALIEGPAIP